MSLQVEVHATAIISSSARMGLGVRIGPYCVIDGEVEIGDATRVGPHTIICGPTRIGRANQIYGQAAIGSDPQDLKFGGERTFLEIGDENTIREFVTINRGTAGGFGNTVIGSGNLLMTGVHIAHDCRIGNRTILANAATLAGHVEIEDFATVGAFVGIHQFCRVGFHAFIGGYSVLTRDALPYIKTVGSRNEAKIYGVNTLGLERKGFEPKRIETLRKAYRILFQRRLRVQQGVEALRREGPWTEDVARLVEFIETSERGFVR